jgi:hypothetical protein
MQHPIWRIICSSLVHNQSVCVSLFRRWEYKLITASMPWLRLLRISPCSWILWRTTCSLIWSSLRFKTSKNGQPNWQKKHWHSWRNISIW